MPRQRNRHFATAQLTHQVTTRHIQQRTTNGTCTVRRTSWGCCCPFHAAGAASVPAAAAPAADVSPYLSRRRAPSTLLASAAVAADNGPKCRAGRGLGFLGRSSSEGSSSAGQIPWPAEQQEGSALCMIVCMAGWVRTGQGGCEMVEAGTLGICRFVRLRLGTCHPIHSPRGIHAHMAPHERAAEQLARAEGAGGEAGMHGHHQGMNCHVQHEGQLQCHGAVREQQILEAVQKVGLRGSDCGGASGVGKEVLGNPRCMLMSLLQALADGGPCCRRQQSTSPELTPNIA